MFQFGSVVTPSILHREVTKLDHHALKSPNHVAVRLRRELRGYCELEGEPLRKFTARVSTFQRAVPRHHPAGTRDDTT